jgi:hypothetical protein
MAERGKAYRGMAGQLAVMAEFAVLGYNVAVPEIDEGDDIFVSEPDTTRIWRVQVKASKAKRPAAGTTPKSEGFQFLVKKDFITDPNNNPPVHVVFAMRSDMDAFWRFLVFERPALKALYTSGSLGKANKRGGVDYIQYSFSRHFAGAYMGTTRGNKADYSQYVSDWSAWLIKPWMV